MGNEVFYKMSYIIICMAQLVLPGWSNRGCYNGLNMKLKIRL
jgi:hypothetical protein